MFRFTPSQLAQSGRREFIKAAGVATLMATAGASTVHADENRTDSKSAPKVRISEIRRVFHNGEHNAFTDLCRYRGDLYLTFRSCPDGHMVHPTSSIHIMVSRDEGKTWTPVHRFSVPKRDTRDPHFLIFKDRLFVLSGTWYSGDSTLAREDYDLNKHLGYAAWTDDGKNWNSPVMLEGTFGHYIWRAASYGSKAYMCGRRKPQFEVKARGEGKVVESLMLESDDGLIWRTCSVLQPIAGDETAFMFDSDGTATALARHGEGKEAFLLRSQAPYQTWQRTDLDRSIGGPLLTKWNGRVVIGGRKTLKEKVAKTSLCWLVDDKLAEFAELPSAGDNSYPGLVELSPTSALVSWYSTHEKNDEGKPFTAIYMARLDIES
ncbi:MAG: hypothetical protein U0892_07790 [Pirellulales bacterium]